MKVIWEKKVRKDPNEDSNEIADYFLSKKSLFCCQDFQVYFKKFSGWDYSTGKFGIVDEITYESHSSVPIRYCPFCGEEIEYANIEKSQGSKKEN